MHWHETEDRAGVGDLAVSGTTLASDIALSEPERPRGKRRPRKHGTEGEYRRGCRCDRCRAAATVRRRARAIRRRVEGERDEVKAALSVVKTIEAEPGRKAELDQAAWDWYLEARRRAAQADMAVAKAELAIKEHMGSAEYLRVNGRVVATWKAETHESYVMPSRSYRRFVPKGGPLVYRGKQR